MWRLTVASLLLLTLALGTTAEAKCRACVESVTADKTGSGSGMTLRFAARGVALPETGTAVVMQVDGNRSKCINVSLRSVGGGGELTSYVGSLTTFYGNSTITGRVDIAGDVWEFSVPMDGSLGTLQLIGAGGAGLVATPVPVRVTPDPVPAAPQTVTATAAPQTAGAVRIPHPTEQPAIWLGAIVIAATLAGAFLDRRRALARATAA